MNAIAKSFIAMSIISVALAATATTASAAETAAPPSVVVSYSDLDLSTRAGAVKLYKRIERAAASVCSDANPSVPLISRDTVLQPCRKQAVTRAIDDVNRSELTALLGSKVRLASR